MVAGDRRSWSGLRGRSPTDRFTGGVATDRRALPGAALCDAGRSGVVVAVAAVPAPEAGNPAAAGGQAGGAIGPALDAGVRVGAHGGGGFTG